MTRAETIIAVHNVVESSRWYQQLFDCNSSHGGDTFEKLTDTDGTVILCLHKWGEHEHPTLRDPNITMGNGLILYFRVSALNKIWDNAKIFKAKIHLEPHLNINTGQNQFTIRDLDGYYVMISE